MTTVQHLAHYLQTHPVACDAPEGIARWWVPASEPPVSVPVVEAALGWMTACGVVEALRAADGRVRYRRSAEATGSDAALAALVADPRSLMPPPPPGAQSMH